jgi:hypothetical protein
MRIGRYINEVCQLLDVEVLHDIEINDAGDVQGFVALGMDGNEAAGVRYAPITKFYPSEEELDEFCELNINRFRIAATSNDCVDAREWR